MEEPSDPRRIRDEHGGEEGQSSQQSTSFERSRRRDDGFHYPRQNGRRPSPEYVDHSQYRAHDYHHRDHRDHRDYSQEYPHRDQHHYESRDNHSEQKNHQGGYHHREDRQLYEHQRYDEDLQHYRDQHHYDDLHHQDQQYRVNQEQYDHHHHRDERNGTYADERHYEEQHRDAYGEAVPRAKTIRPLQLRLVKLVSDVMPPEQKVAVIDSRGEGISIGRDRSFTARIRCPSMEVSKHHANIFKNESVFAIADTGSTHGTYLLIDPPTSLTPESLPPIKAYHRLSEPKKASAPETIEHLSLLRVGKTVFQAHLHDGRTSCDECVLSEDGSNEILLFAKDKKETKSVVTSAYQLDQETKRQASEVKITPKQAMRELKSRHLGDSDALSSQQSEADSSQYVDRAAARRARGGVQTTKPSPVPSTTSGMPPVIAPIVTSLPAAKLTDSNRGYQMFAAMSFKSGEKGLASQDPIFARGVEGRAGLGSKRLLDVQQMATRSDYSQEGIREKQRRRFEEAG
ncbi:hypothetical protein CBS101457_002454 [Exobasidium rhododendri]|nr:hypothetical protein CBS101457_002454 [Exobasidium rhododendri]